MLERRNYLFAGSDAGGETAARLYSLIGTCRLNDLDPHLYLRYVLGRIATHPINRLKPQWSPIFGLCCKVESARRTVASPQSGRLACGSSRMSGLGRSLVSTKMIENPLDDGGVFNAGDDPKAPSAAQARLNVDPKHALQALCPSHRRSPLRRSSFFTLQLRTESARSVPSMAIFGSAALLLAAIGIYGLMAYSVQQRQQEIGIRMALGAGADRVKGMVVRQVLLVVVGAGLMAAFYTANVLAAFLFEFEPRDPAVFVAVPC